MYVFKENIIPLAYSIFQLYILLYLYDLEGLEHVDGSGVPGTKSCSSLITENCPGQDLCWPEDGYVLGQESYIYTSGVAS